jgi:hypothetical protein
LYHAGVIITKSLRLAEERLQNLDAQEYLVAVFTPMPSALTAFAHFNSSDAEAFVRNPG